MKLLVHRKAIKTIAVKSSDKEDVILRNEDCLTCIWELAERYPEELIGWCEESLVEDINVNEWDNVFHHDLIMASFAVKTTFLPDQIGYIDQLPFINVNRRVLYGTWLMSSDMGGIKGRTLLKFKPLLGSIKNFDYLLNSVAKIGQQHSLFCYSAPQLKKSGPKENPSKELSTKAKTADMFAFVYQHYNTVWTFILLLNLVVYERVFPLRGYLGCFFREKFFKKPLKLPIEGVVSTKARKISRTVDVIIPTMGRADYLHKVLQDFSQQTHLPERIIIVEQDADPKSVSKLNFLNGEKWPFEIEHYFIHQVGACNARNLALSKTKNCWVFLSDDDQRFGPNLIECAIDEVFRLGVDGLTTSYLQPSEKKDFMLPKQWGSFGAGNSIVLKEKLSNIQFSPEHEFGYGEDVDFGMQLRNSGCDIIYHPGLEITHLKAPIGGFRTKPELEWEREGLEPKPSPTLMALALKHYTQEQLNGSRTSLYIRYYGNQPIKNPFSYLNQMNKRWNASAVWAKHLMGQKIVKLERYVEC